MSDTGMKARVEKECHRRTVHLNKHIRIAWIARRWQERKAELYQIVYRNKIMNEASARFQEMRP